MPRRNSLGRTSRPSPCRAVDEGFDVVRRDVEDHELLLSGQAHAAGAVLLGEVGDAVEHGAADAPDGRRGADVRQAVVLRVDADVVATPWVRRCRRPVDQRPLQVLRLDDLADLRGAPVGDEELQPRAGAQPAVAVVAEDRDHGLPHVGHLVERHPHAEALGEHRVRRQATADVDVEAGTVLGVHDADERDVVDLVGDVLARRAGDGGLELARQVREPRVADVAAHDLVDGRRPVDDLVGGDAGHGGAEHDARRVAARLVGGQADRLEPLPDRGHVLDADPVQLHVLPVGDVGGVAPVGLGDVGDRAQLLGSQQPAVAAHAEHEVLVVELVRLERSRCGRRRSRACAGCRAPTSACDRAGRSGRSRRTRCASRCSRCARGRSGRRRPS